MPNVYACQQGGGGQKFSKSFLRSLCTAPYLEKKMVYCCKNLIGVCVCVRVCMHVQIFILNVDLMTHANSFIDISILYKYLGTIQVRVKKCILTYFSLLEARTL